MSLFLYEFDRNEKFGPASKEAVEQYKAALGKGQKYFLYPWHGLQLRMVVRAAISASDRPLPEA